MHPFLLEAAYQLTISGGFMRFLLLLACVFLGPDAFASSSKIISDKEAAQVLRNISNICGDTWCEGDFNFDFKTLDCYDTGEAGNRKAQCEMTFDMIRDEYVHDDKEMVVSLGQVYPAKCEFSNLKREDLIDKTRSGSITYSEVIYEKVSDCISHLEKHIFAKDKK